MTTTIDNNSVLPDATSIDDTDSPYTTSGEDTIQVDTSSGAVTVTLATADLKAGREIRVIDSGLNAGTNNITINTEGTETINPGANSSISIAIDGGYEDFFSDGNNWFSSRNRNTATIDNLDGTGLQYEQVGINQVAARGELTTEQNVPTDTITQINIDNADINDSDVLEVDTANNKIIAKKAGKYRASAVVTLEDSTNWSSGDMCALRIKVGGTYKDIPKSTHPGSDGTNNNFSVVGAANFEIASPNADIIFEVRHLSGGQETLPDQSFGTHIDVEFIG